MDLRNKNIGITTTVPVEIILAGEAVPVDLNNIFICGENPSELVDAAEHAGYPRGICAWIKGIYASVVASRKLDVVLIASEGDCSNTLAMMDTFISKGIKTLSFEYPRSRNIDELERSLRKMAADFGTTLEAAEKVREKLKPLRKKLERLDELTWKEHKVTGGENHIRLVSSSDFNGNPAQFENDLNIFIAEAEERKPFIPKIKLAYLGVPPIISDFYQYIESKSAYILLNEMQREFSMPGDFKNLVEQYLDYTYPYDIFHRMSSLIPELKKRGIQGVIHYVQSFCHRQIEDILIREKLDMPVLTLEGDRPGKLDERTKLRIDAFLDILS